jgi:tRNA modification GTPase
LVRRRLVDPLSGEELDDALVVWMPGPASFTGEDQAEFHCHGGPAVIAALAHALGAGVGCRVAEPGEFTRRAFANGKLDLSQVEGLADLIAAETETQRRLALRVADGALQRLYDGWRERVLRAAALIAATIDFTDEELPDGVMADALAIAGEVASAIDGHLAQGGIGERLRDGVVVAIVGPPNVGKSSLLNRLVGRPAAIVAAVAGTTRDPIEARMDLGGVPVPFIDTAGLRATDDPVESEGVRRAEAKAKGADLVLMVTAPGAPPTDAPTTLGQASIAVWNKCDLAPAPAGMLGVSAETGAAIDQLCGMIAGEVARLLPAGDSLPIVRARHRGCLVEALAALRAAAMHGAVELAAEELRVAAHAIGRITGRVSVDDLLDVIFREFCLGK